MLCMKYYFAKQPMRLLNVVLAKHSHFIYQRALSAPFSSSIQLLKKKPAGKRDARAHIDFIRNLCETNNFGAVRNALKEMQLDGFRLNPAFTILIKHYGRASLFEDAALVLYQMKSFNCHPDVATYRCLVDVLMKGGCHEKLGDIQDTMLKDEVIPDTTTGKNLLLNLSILGRIPELHRFCHRLNDLGCHIPQDFVPQILRENLTSVNPINYNKEFYSLVKELGLDRRNFKALKALDSMLEQIDALDSVTCIVIIDGLCKLNKLGRANMVLGQLRTKGTVPEGFLYDIVANCLVREGKLNDVETVWEEIGVGVGLGSFDYVKFIRYLCGKGEVQEAIKMFRRVVEAGGVLDEQGYVAFIGGLCKEGDGYIAKEVIPMMKRDGFFPDMILYIALFQCFCRVGNMYEADIILRKMIRRNYDPDICVYASFISGLCKAGKLREANKLFKKLIKNDAVARVPSVKRGKRAIFQLNVSGAIPEVVAYGIFIRSLCSIGKFKEAGTLLKEMMQKGLSPDVCVFNSFIKGFCMAGKIDEARKFYKISCEKGLISLTDGTVSLIHGLCKADKSDEAMGLFDGLVNDGFVPTASICNALITCHWKAGKTDMANKMFERMISGSCGRPDISTYNTMLEGLCNEGNVVEACSLFQSMKNTKLYVNEVSYSTVIRGLCNAGDFEAAHKLLNEMTETGNVFTFKGWRRLSSAIYEEKVSDHTAP
eukprot:Gb_13319 [translate_table: standard]